jgi:hypothetical protein
MSATGGVRVHDDSSGAKRFEERTKCADLVGDFRLPLGAGREPGELVYKEGTAKVFPVILATHA